MRGVSPAKTLEYQRAALQLVNERDISAEGAMLMMYAGVFSHFAGDYDEGYALRKKGLHYLEQFENKEVENEAMLLFGWHDYLLGDFTSVIADYANMILAIESKKEIDIVVFILLYRWFQRALTISRKFYLLLGGGLGVPQSPGSLSSIILATGTRCGLSLLVLFMVNVQSI